MPSRWSTARRSRTWTVAVMVATAAAILVVSYLANRPEGGGGSLTSVVLAAPASGPAPEVGKSAPDFSAKTIEGPEVTLGKLRGKPVWVTFGATWCQECRVESPDIQAAYEKYRSQGLEVLSVSIQDDRSDIVGYAERAGLTFPKIDDRSEEIASSYRIAGIPSHFFVDRSGVLRTIEISALDPPTIDENLAEIGVDVDRSAN
jgi:cytochrome c biogenesis protein CcmG/thiol:disulfide interchange protein DsbE